jgi:hypothetical protein
MTYVAEMDEGAMIYITSVMEISSGIQKSKEGDSQTHRQYGSHKHTFIF